MRLTTNTYEIGAVPRLRAVFTDTDGVAADPTDITLKIIEPDDPATVTTYVYGTDAELVREDVGIYYVDWETRVAGEHCYRFVGTGDVRAVAERHFTVDAGCFS